MISFSVSPDTNKIQHNCDWSQFPVVVDCQSQVYQNRDTIVAILDQSLSNPIDKTHLDRENLCTIATTIDKEFCRAMDSYIDSLDNATQLDKGRKRSISKTHTLSASSTWEKLIEEYQQEHHCGPSWWENMWLAIQSVFVTRTATELVIKDFPEEYNDYHRREWMVKVLTLEEARIERAIKLIRQGAIKCATNIKNARDEYKPVHQQDVDTLNQLIKLYGAFDPDKQLQMGALGTANNYLENGGNL